MRLRKTTLLGMVAVTLLVMAAVYTFGWLHGRADQAFPLLGEAQAAGGVVKSATGTAPDRYVN